MTAAKKSKNKAKQGVKRLTPKGVLVYPKLTKPDYGTQEYPDKEGSYRTNLRMNRNDAGVEAFLQKLDELMELSKQEAEAIFAALPLQVRKKAEASQGGIQAQLPYTEIYDEATEEPTGEVEVRIKRKASGERNDGTKWVTPPPPIFDSASPPKRLPKAVEVWSGSTGVVNVEAFPYFVNATCSYGVSLRLNAVQIRDLVSIGGAQNAEAYGFEGGDGFDYEASQFEEATATEESDASVDEEADADF